MKWVIGTLVLIGAGVLLRRLLRLDQVMLPRTGGLLLLSPDREAIFQPIAQEVETQAAILGISLNDAFEERDAGRADIAWRLIRLSVSEWDRLTEIVKLLLNSMGKHLASAQVAVPVRSMVAHRFKSRIMIDYARIHELLDQLVFRSRLRFQLHLRVLQRAMETLTAEFRRSYRYAERTEDHPPELWNRLDIYFHDLDLVVKEALLALRAFLVCLPHAALERFAADLRTVVSRGVRSSSISANR